MVEVTITYSPELKWNMITNLDFHDDEGTMPENEKSRIREAFKSIDNKFLDRFEMMTAEKMISETLGVDKQTLDVHVHEANECMSC